MTISVHEIMEQADDLYMSSIKMRSALNAGLISRSDLRDLFTAMAETAEGEVYEGYSGRYAFGKKCWGITGDLPRILMVAGRFGMPVPSYESLGRETIVYWPEIAYTEAE